tara:strand:+ start:1742 stop:1948 length:207 start_codon:yes stop_codon:yes gene_type:complete
MTLTKNEQIFVLNYYDYNIPFNVNANIIKKKADMCIDSNLCKPIIGKNLKYASISKKRLSRNSKKKYN